MQNMMPIRMNVHAIQVTVAMVKQIVTISMNVPNNCITVAVRRQVFVPILLALGHAIVAGVTG